jgi:hypothetical protein
VNKELDCLIIGFSVGSLASLWVGYWLRGRVERWRRGRSARAHERAIGPARRDAKHIPFTHARDEHSALDVVGRPREQRVRNVLSGKPRVIPIPKRDDAEVGHEHHRVKQPIPLPCDSFHEPGSIPSAAFLRGAELDALQAKETARIIRDDAVAALTGAGYKRAAAEAALDACTLAERAGGLESWVACAFRRAAAKP